MAYKNILNRQMAEYNQLYKKACKAYPSYSIKDKQLMVFGAMKKARNISDDDCMKMMFDALINNGLTYQYACEVVLTRTEVESGIPRYYLKDDSLFDFFKTTKINPKDVQSIFVSDIYAKGSAFGVIGQSFSCVINVTVDLFGKHFIGVFTDDMNYTFCVEDVNIKKGNSEIFNLAMNFLFYIQAFPECIVDGVPSGVKKNPVAKQINISEKIVSHRDNTEHGFVRPHFRSGYFRHLNSDYFVNCKGQVRFIESTMVKGRAKTVLNKE